MDLDELGDQGIGGGSEALSGITPDGVALGVDQDQGRPRAHAITPPDGHVGVVDDGMFDFIAKNGLADALGILLIVKLRRVDADHDQLIRVLLFQLGQFGQRLNTVDTTESPEIDEYDLAAQIPELERAGGIEPGHAAVELRRPDPAQVAVVLFFFRLFLGGIRRLGCGRDRTGHEGRRLTPEPVVEEIKSSQQAKSRGDDDQAARQARTRSTRTSKLIGHLLVPPINRRIPGRYGCDQRGGYLGLRPILRHWRGVGTGQSWSRVFATQETPNPKKGVWNSPVSINAG